MTAAESRLPKMCTAEALYFDKYMTTQRIPRDIAVKMAAELGFVGLSFKYFLRQHHGAGLAAFTAILMPIFFILMPDFFARRAACSRHVRARAQESCVRHIGLVIFVPNSCRWAMPTTL